MPTATDATTASPSRTGGRFRMDLDMNGVHVRACPDQGSVRQATPVSAAAVCVACLASDRRGLSIGAQLDDLGIPCRQR